MSVGTNAVTSFYVTVPNADEVSLGMVIAERYVDSDHRLLPGVEPLNSTLVYDRSTESCETLVLYVGPFAFVAYASGKNKRKQPSQELWREIVRQVGVAQGKSVIPFPDSHIETLARVVRKIREQRFLLLLIAVSIAVAALSLVLRSR